MADAARRAPRLVVIGDLHGCPPEELALVAGLVRATAVGPVAVVVTARPDAAVLAPEGGWAEATRGVPLDELPLAPLDASATARLAEALGDPATRRWR